jgi:hypothetical protein
LPPTAYSFLDPNKEHAFLAVYIVGIGVGDAIVFVIARGVTVLRQRFVVRRGLLEKDDSHGVMGRGGEGGTGEAIDEWEEVEPPVVDGKPGEGPRVNDSAVAV